VVLLINSPGGSPVQAGIDQRRNHPPQGQHNKPVYAVVEETCASAAYYIAAAADEIYVDKASIVGSIGVLMDGFGFTGTMEKLGVERRLLTAGENKGFLDPSARRRPAARLCAADARPDPPAVHRGREGGPGRAPEGHARDLQRPVLDRPAGRGIGLADQYGTLDYVAREVVKAEDVIDYAPRQRRRAPGA
jgi:protease-4